MVTGEMMRLKQPFFAVGICALVFSACKQSEEAQSQETQPQETTSEVQTEGVKFQLKFEPGKEYLTDTEMKQNMVMPMGGQQLKTSMTMNVVGSQTVSKVGEDVQVIQKMDSLVMDMNAAGMEIQFDSENPQGPMAAMIAPMMNAKSTMTLGADGEVISIVADVAPGMENMGMGEDEIKQSAREVSDLMANKVVAEGESWKATSTLPLGGMTAEPVSISYTMTFDSMIEKDGHELAKVLVEGVIDEDDGNLKVTSKDLSGEILFDPAIGQPREMTMVIDLEIGVPDGVSVQEGAGGKMPMRMETSSKLKAIK